MAIQDVVVLRAPLGSRRIKVVQVARYVLYVITVDGIQPLATVDKPCL